MTQEATTRSEGAPLTVAGHVASRWSTLQVVDTNGA